MPWQDECVSFLKSIQLAAQSDILLGDPKKPQRIILRTNQWKFQGGPEEHLASKIAPWWMLCPLETLGSPTEEDRSASLDALSRDIYSCLCGRSHSDPTTL